MAVIVGGGGGQLSQSGEAEGPGMGGGGGDTGTAAQQIAEVLGVELQDHCRGGGGLSDWAVGRGKGLSHRGEEGWVNAFGHPVGCGSAVGGEAEAINLHLTEGALCGGAELVQGSPAEGMDQRARVSILRRRPLRVGPGEDVQEKVAGSGMAGSWVRAAIQVVQQGIMVPSLQGPLRPAEPGQGLPRQGAGVQQCHICRLQGKSWVHIRGGIGNMLGRRRRRSAV